MTFISRAALDPSGHTSFSFYEFWPGQGLIVEDAPRASTAERATIALLDGDLLALPKRDLPAIGDAQLDDFAALLLTHGHRLKANERFERLADATARGFAALIGNEAMRPRRMRLTRISLMLRVILDRGRSTSGVIEESVLAVTSPWDLLGDWIVTCDEDNVRRVSHGVVTWSRRLGLPTQLDALGDALWIGSHYSDGGYVVREQSSSEPQVQRIEHDRPLVLAFDFDGARYALDASGALFDMNDGALGMTVLRLPCDVHRARVIGNMLYAFDWGQAGVGFAIDLSAMSVTVFSTGAVIVCNDVCGDGSDDIRAIYAICKLQGRIFKMARGSKRAATHLGAGVKRGQLLDPIMIRSNADGTLDVLNWFSSKLVKLKAF